MLRKTINCLLPLQLIAVSLLFFFTSCKKMKEDLRPEDNELDKPVSMSVTADPVAQAPVNYDALLTSFPRKKWMEKIDDDVKISHLSIPGTNNSAMPDYQTNSYREQLDNGVRYLDITLVRDRSGTSLEVMANLDNFGPYLNTSFDMFLSGCKDFLNQNPSETIILLIDFFGSWNHVNDYYNPAQKVTQAGENDPNIFYKWPNFFDAAAAATVDWPRLKELRGKIMMVSPNNKFAHQPFIRVWGELRRTVTMGFARNASAGAPKIEAKLVHEKQVTVDQDKWGRAITTLISADNATATNAADRAATLYLNDAGLDILSYNTNNITDHANFMNPRLEDVFELQYNESPSTGRFGIVATDRLAPYLAGLIYLTNFNRYTKKFKSKLMGGYSGYAYNTDGTIQGYTIPQLTGTHYTTFPSGIGYGNFMTQKNWMSHISDETPLSAMNIPGTHDAATSTGTIGAKCQSVDIKAQLDAGVRVLDLRLLAIKDGSTNKLISWHWEMYPTITWASELQTVVNFLNANPSETVILNVAIDDYTEVFQANGGFSMLVSSGTAKVLFQRDLNNYINYFWRNSEAHGPYPVTWPTMGELRGKIFLMAQDESDITGNSNVGINIRYGSPARAWYDGHTDWKLSITSGGGPIDGLGAGAIWENTWSNKWTYIANNFIAAENDRDMQRLYTTGSSYTQPSPVAAATGINSIIRNWIAGGTSIGNPTPRRYGILNMDFVDETLIAYDLLNFSAYQLINP